nr:hypothetical protein [Myroides guanonis]
MILLIILEHRRHKINTLNQPGI